MVLKGIGVRKNEDFFKGILPFGIEQLSGKWGCNVMVSMNSRAPVVIDQQPVSIVLIKFQQSELLGFSLSEMHNRPDPVLLNPIFYVRKFLRLMTPSRNILYFFPGMLILNAILGKKPGAGYALVFRVCVYFRVVLVHPFRNFYSRLPGTVRQNKIGSVSGFDA